MTFIKALTPQLAEPSKVNDLIAPPYDIVNHAQVQNYLNKKPNSIINVTRPDGLFDKTTDFTVIKKGYLAALKNLNEKINTFYNPHSSPCFLIYQIIGQGVKQTGLVCLTDSEQLITHELTRKAKVIDRMQLSEQLKCQTSPVMLCTDPKLKLSDLLNKKIATAQRLYNIDYENYQHNLFLMDTSTDLNDIEIFFSKVNSIYITDGHHRSQTQLSLHQKLPDTFSKHILSVVFPGEELKILGYHRVVKIPSDSDLQAFWACAEVNFEITRSKMPVLPRSEIDFGCFVEDSWYQFKFKKPQDKKLAIDILHGELIETFFRITKPKEDPNIDFIGGAHATQSIENYCLENKNWIGFTLAPTTVEEIIKTGDAKKIMPPKSTYFEPKLLDGFFLQEEGLRD